MIVKSQDIKGKLTHWLYRRYVPSALKGEFVLQPGGPLNKPQGLWLSWNEGWERWCESENFGDLSKKACLHAQLKPNLNIWLIDSMADFLDIWHEFKGRKRIHPKDYSVNSIMGLYQNNFWEWLRGIKHIDGIALTDKGQWATRWDTWLYGWDAASIVIFDPSNVKLTDYQTWRTETNEYNRTTEKDAADSNQSQTD